ncbi:MAG: hypothetical protein NUW23_00005, partial [Firmicutes bacterium]|nr:hypothetical protein [Bacillota bacterium]
LTPDDDYFFQVRSVDAVGWTSTGVEASIRVDTARPVLSNGAPTGYIGNATPTISADFADVGVGLDASETVLTLTYDGSPTDITSGFTGMPGYADSLTATNIQYTPGTSLDDGEYTVDMVAYDLAGNKSTPDETLQWTFNVDTTPPTDPGNPVAGNAHDDGTWYINTLRPTFSWAASEDPDAPDGTPGSGLSEYWFQFGTQASKPLTTVDPWVGALVDQTGIVPTAGANTQQWTPASDLALAVGVEYSARVKAFDNVGNASAWVDPIIIFDPDPPTAPGTPITTTPTTDKTPTWEWEGSTDAISGIDLYHIQIRRQGSLDWDVLDTFMDIPDALDPGAQTWTQGLQLEDGTYEIRVRAMDVAGNYSDWSGIGIVEVDTTPPAVPAIKALNDGYKTSPIEIDWSDVSDGTNTITYVLQYADNAGFDSPTEVTALTASNYDFDADAEGEGEYWFRVKTVSTLPGAGGTKESGWSAIVSTIYDKTGPAAPVLMLETPNPTNESPQTWSWSAPAGATGYLVSVNGGTWIDVYDTRTYQTTFAATGTYTFAVKAYDWLANEGLETAGSVEVDVDAPAVPTGLTVTSPTTDKTPTWSWTAVSGAAGYEIRLDGAIIMDVGTATSYTHSEELGDGSHTLEVRSYDALGNKSDWCEAVTVIVDTTPPAVPGIPTTQSPTKNVRPSWTWTLSPGAVVYNVYLDGEATPSLTVAQPTPPDPMLFVYPADLAEGTHHLQVTALDDLGNESARSDAGHVVIDLTPPAVPAIPPMPAYTNADAVGLFWATGDGAVKYDVEYSIGGVVTTVNDIDVQTLTIDISSAADGDEVTAKVRA